MKTDFDALVRHEVWTLIKDHPRIGIPLAIRLGLEHVLMLLCPRLSLWMAERALRRIDPRFLTLKKKNHV